MKLPTWELSMFVAAITFAMRAAREPSDGNNQLGQQTTVPGVSRVRIVYNLFQISSACYAAILATLVATSFIIAVIL